MRNSPLIHICGEILFDHFPDGSHILGGAPFNVASGICSPSDSLPACWAASVPIRGQEIVQLMKSRGMYIDALQTDPNHPTGSVQVAIDHGEPHYKIVSDCAYDFIDPKLVAEQSSQGILYHGALTLRNPVSRAALHTVKARRQGKIFIDVNLRGPRGLARSGCRR